MGWRRGERGGYADKKGMRSRTDTGWARRETRRGGGCEVSLPHASSRLPLPHASLLCLAVRASFSAWHQGMRAGGEAGVGVEERWSEVEQETQNQG